MSRCMKVCVVLDNCQILNVDFLIYYWCIRKLWISLRSTTTNTLLFTPREFIYYICKIMHEFNTTDNELNHKALYSLISACYCKTTCLNYFRPKNVFPVTQQTL
jgi:hypothetical protein